MGLSTNDKFNLLLKAADIAISSDTAAPEQLARIIETTYNKMVELGTKE